MQRRLLSVFTFSSLASFQAYAQPIVFDFQTMSMTLPSVSIGPSNYQLILHYETDGKLSIASAKPITAPITAPVLTTALTVEFEPNNGVVANPLTQGVPLTGQISNAADQDWFAVMAASAGTMTMKFSTSQTAANAGWKYSIRDVANNTLAAGICIEGATCYNRTLSTGVSSAGTYYLVVEMGQNKYSVNTENYTLSFDFSGLR
jgi:hypothetical protein